jgi:hypothetical protein
MGSEDMIMAKLMVFLYANLTTKSTTLIYEKYMSLAALECPRFQALDFKPPNSPLQIHVIFPKLANMPLFPTYICHPNILPVALVFYNSIVS